MGILEALLPFVLLVLILIGVKAVWMSGFVAGTLGEAKLWLSALDKLYAPNWQNLPVNEFLAADSTLSAEQTKYVNQVYVQCYAIALYNIGTGIAAARREIVEKANAEEEAQRRRFER